jgi:alpha-amylase
MKRLAALSILFTLTACQLVPAGQSRRWWDNTVFYEIFVRSFYDSNGDGIGDLNGVTQKLDYLKDLGIGGLWLMPIFPSPSYHGYDVTDYYSINPQYGTLDDFKRLLAEAHKRGMRVILDLPLNHTSNLHPWFLDANSGKQSVYRDWYLWSDTDLGYLNPSNGQAWNKGITGYYFSIFSPRMPDLNYRNPAVTAEMEKVTRFWLAEVGIDGFRLDAAKHLIEQGEKQENTASTHEWYKGYYQAYKADKPDAFVIGEAFNADAFLASTYTGDQLDMMFDFELASGFVNSANGGGSSAVDSALTFAKESLPSWQFGSFLTNHDQNRVMSVLNGDLNKARVAASLLLTSPGVPFLYYGEEIGMTGEKPDPQIRRPMQWSDAPNAGFTGGKPWEALATGQAKTNVAAESADPASLLSHYKRLIALRNAHSALRNGSLSLLSTGNPGVYAALRYDGSDAILVIVNLTKTAISDYSLSLPDAVLKDGSHPLTDLFGGQPATTLSVTSGAFSAFKPLESLPGYGTFILEIQP